ncbi:Uncharacterized protein APZ42_031116 [Daphnia magna]|uniref:Myb/SANT-like DNA-binding domain-containing protein n=1 Tax=Daphnia magna TaxID=35525 RepID=A0A164N4K4_9CRUS|nr:Uncharacterized protein APZ42_031116 [Daphnia magna]
MPSINPQGPLYQKRQEIIKVAVQLQTSFREAETFNQQHSQEHNIPQHELLTEPETRSQYPVEKHDPESTSETEELKNRLDKLEKRQTQTEKAINKMGILVAKIPDKSIRKIYLDHASIKPKRQSQMENKRKNKIKPPNDKETDTPIFNFPDFPDKDMDIDDEIPDAWECWNGGKRASQLLIDFEATELFLNLVKEKWVVLKDSKTSKKQVWDDIAIGLDEEGFLVRGEDKGVTCKTKWENLRRDYRCYISKFSQTGSGASDTNKKPKHFDQIEEILGEKNHSYRPPFISDSLNKKQNPTIFKDTANSKECKRDDECLEKDLELPKTATVNENKTSQEEGDISKAEKEKCKKSRKNNSESDIDDDDIYVDELDEEDVSSNLKKKDQAKQRNLTKCLWLLKK